MPSHIQHSSHSWELFIWIHGLFRYFRYYYDMTLEEFKTIAEDMPDEPGVYFFLGPHKETLYIGKATSLRTRVRSYFANDIAVKRSQLIAAMVEKAAGLDWRQTDSVLEALILEANLIKHHTPEYNTQAKDDKSWNFVVITKEDFPRVLLVRGKNLDVEWPESTRAYTFGPFPHGLQLKEALKLVRKIFPYRENCTPAEEMIAAGKPVRGCFNQHIGLCPGVCTGDISKADYRKIIRHIVLLFQGKKKQLVKELEKAMVNAAKNEEFEEATKLRQQIYALTHIHDVSLIKDEYRRPPTTGVVDRIEAYDMAHLAGSANVGVMTVVEGGMASRAEYRKFKIRLTAGNDTGALREVLTRRLGHDEWPLAQLIVVDGSTAQINTAEAVLRELGMEIPVVGVVKDDKHRPRGINGRRDLIAGRERDILLANAEAHRFAIGYHRKRKRAELGL
ncbi:MAG: UvrABC system protein excinuclease subunit [Candidatus Adlerbacteria bacterium]|nr:UvrABC system protein excinuclease subunit [Candidatus Adlerbacteria bacterium]